MIAPNLYVDPSMVGSNDVRLVVMPTISNNPTIDTFDPNLGPYGDSNKGPAPTFVPNSPMPTMAVPELGASVGDVLYKGNGTSTLSSSMKCTTFTLSNNRTLNISGNVTIVCEESFVVQNHTKIVLLDGATLTVFALKDAKFENNVDLNMNTCQSSRFMFCHLGESNLVMENSARAYMQLTAPNASLHVKNNCDFHGKLKGKSAIIDNGAGLHIETGGVEFCGVEPADIVGVHGVASTGGIPSAAAFNTWYTDVLGTNLSMPYTVTLVRNSTNTMWQYLNTAFYPIDRMLMGNQGQAHNYYFTWTCSANFIHHACTGTFADFSGNDDMWIFINGELVMDRGGVLPAPGQYVDVDRLGLVDGNVYTIQMFYSQRSTATSQFKFKTNLDLIPDEAMVVQVSGPMD
jgi:fibro-slime domain-containing protein